MIGPKQDTKKEEEMANLRTMKETIIWSMVTLFVVVPVGVAYYGYAAVVIWGWFAVPAGAPEIGMVDAVLALAAVRAFAANAEWHYGEKDPVVITQRGAIRAVFGPSLALFFAWLIL